MMKIWIKRALRTFFQAFAGTLSTQIIALTADITDVSISKSVIISLIASAIAAGVSAVMNLKEEF